MSLNGDEKNTAYEKLTPQRKQLVDKVMENLEKGNLFWTQGWVSSGAPESAITGKKYRGINNLFLSLIAISENYGDNRWATFNQMEEKGWTFKKDEEGNSLAKGKGASIEYYEMRDKETKKRFDRSVLDGMTADEQREYMEKNVYWLRKFYRVFNCSLMDGVPAKEKPSIDVNDRNDRAEAVLDYWDKNEAKIVYGGSQAFYRTDTDEVYLPERADFKSMQEFYATALHEIGHSTGHESRLHRDLSGRFGSEGYAMEELRAEIASVFMEQDLEVEPGEKRLQNNAAYIQSWREEIKENPNALFTAITDADKIAKYVSERVQTYRKIKDAGDDGIAGNREGKGVTEKTEQEKSKEYMRPSEIVAAEAVARASPADRNGRGIASLTRMSDREVFTRAERFYSKTNKFSDLYQGKQVLPGEKKSEYGLMIRLAMFCGNDEEQLLRLFRSSGQYRDEKPDAYYKNMASESMRSMQTMRATVTAAKGNRGAAKEKAAEKSKR